MPGVAVGVAVGVGVAVDTGVAVGIEFAVGCAVGTAVAGVLPVPDAPGELPLVVDVAVLVALGAAPSVAVGCGSAFEGISSVGVGVTIGALCGCVALVGMGITSVNRVTTASRTAVAITIKTRGRRFGRRS